MMMFGWGYKSPNLDTIKAIVSREDATIEEVLLDEGLTQALLYETMEVIEFLARDEMSQKLIEYSLTLMHESHEKYTKLARVATNVLTTSCTELQKRFSDSDIVMNAIIGFLNDPGKQSSRICGHYQRIIEHMIRVSRGQILTRLGDYPVCLIDHIDVLALRYLLVQLLTELREYFTDITPALDKLGNVIGQGGDIGYAALSSVREILKDGHILNNTDPILAKLFGDVLKFASNLETIDFYKAEAFGLLAYIMKNYPSPSYDTHLKMYEDSFADTDRLATSGVYRVYRNKLASAFDTFLEFQDDPFLGNVVLEEFQKMESSMLHSFCVDNDIIPKLIQQYKKDSKAMGHAFEIAIFLACQLSISDLTSTKEYRAFMSKYIDPTINLLAVSNEYKLDNFETYSQLLKTKAPEPSTSSDEEEEDNKEKSTPTTNENEKEKQNTEAEIEKPNDLDYLAVLTEDVDAEFVVTPPASPVKEATNITLPKSEICDFASNSEPEPTIEQCKDSSSNDKKENEEIKETNEPAKELEKSENDTNEVDKENEIEMISMDDVDSEFVVVDTQSNKETEPIDVPQLVEQNDPNTETQNNNDTELSNETSDKPTEVTEDPQLDETQSPTTTDDPPPEAQTS